MDNHTFPLDNADFSSHERGSFSLPFHGSKQPQDDYQIAWRERYAQLPLLHLPSGQRRSSPAEYRQATHAFTFPHGLAVRLRMLSQQEGVRLFMLLLAAFDVLLYRYSDQDAVAVWLLLKDDPHQKPAQAMGGLDNLLLIRAKMARDLPFRTLLQSIKQEYLAANEHQQQAMPFRQLLSDMEQNQLQLLVRINHWIAERPPLEEADTSATEETGALCACEIVLDITDMLQVLHGRLVYNAALFDAPLIEKMATHYQVLLESIVAHVSLPLANLPLLSQEERILLTINWNQTRTAFPEDLCLHQLVEAQALLKTTDTAVVSSKGSLTYEHLNTSANQLAHYLQKQGVGPDICVGLCMEHSLELVIGILGILKAGGAYVPLDPHYPGERITFMLQNSQVSYLLTQYKLSANPAFQNTRVICIDADWPIISEEATSNPMCAVSPYNLAYVIYTSGSTGQPKGIALQHQGVVNNLTDINRRFLIGARDSVLALSSLSFDMCVYEILGLLGAGGTVVIPDAERAREPRHWAELVREQHITVWNSAPSLLEIFIASITAWPELWPGSLRLALLGGDWIPLSLPDRLKAVAPEVQVIGLGGATEASIHSTIYPYTQGDPSWKSIPYGKPMANQWTYILDLRLQPVPAGTSGELYLAGIGLARGYFNRPDFTAERFLPNPFSEQAGARMYRTGDLACYQFDGTIELLGRIDFQVKIRGLRIELEEIARRLRQLPAIQEVVVLASPATSGEKRLIAYLVAIESASLSLNELRNFVAQTLPEYMIPADFIFIDELPLSPNGKVDRQALLRLKPLISHPESSSVRTVGNPVEEVLRDVWADILHLEQVGLYDNFYKLGGDSLAAIRILSNIQEIFNVNVTLRSLLEVTTVAKQAELLSDLGHTCDQDVARIARLFLWLDQLSENEVERFLAERDAQSTDV